jgi:hypothetical protein
LMYSQPSIIRPPQERSDKRIDGRGSDNRGLTVSKNLAVVGKLSTIFTPAQYGQIVALAIPLTLQLPLGPISYATLLTDLKNVLFNNLCPFYSQVKV